MMVWHQKHCGKGCFGSPCCLYKQSFDIFVLDAGKLHLPLVRMLCARGEGDGVAWHSSARGGVA